MSAANLDRDLQAALISERAIETAAPAMLDLPGQLPVEHLSHSSIALLRKCPEKWRRRYILREYEPPSGSMIVGSSAGAAERINFEQKITTGTDLSKADVLDAFADEWRSRSNVADIDWGSEKPDRVRETGRAALEAYHELIAPGVRPVTVERQFTLRFEGVAWTFLGYLDLEEADGAVGDTKCKAKRLSQVDADSDPQATSYLLAKRAEGNPASEFRFHTMVRTAKPVAEIIRTSRTDRQLDVFLHRIFAAAAEIDWRATNDVWDGAVAGAWWCSEKWCGYWHQCPMGGGA